MLCFNKTDIAESPEIAELQDIYAACGYPVLFTSAREEENIEELEASPERKDDSYSRSFRGGEIISDQSASVRESRWRPEASAGRSPEAVIQRGILS